MSNNAIVYDTLPSQGTLMALRKAPTPIDPEDAGCLNSIDWSVVVKKNTLYDIDEYEKFYVLYSATDASGAAAAAGAKPRELDIWPLIMG